MHQPSLEHLALLVVLALTTACGGAQSHAESPDPTASSSSGSSSAADSAASKGDTQLPESALGKADERMQASAAPAAKPESSSAAEDAIISGNALPPSPNTTSAPRAAKPTKAKRPVKMPKKTAQASRG